MSDKSNSWRAGAWERPEKLKPSLSYLLFPLFVAGLGAVFWFNPRLDIPDERDLVRVDGVAQAKIDELGIEARIRLSGFPTLLIVKENCGFADTIVQRIASSAAPISVWISNKPYYVKSTGEPYRRALAIRRGGEVILSYASCEQAMMSNNKLGSYACFIFALIVTLIYLSRYFPARARYRRAISETERDQA